ncbi:hypothetical protein [Shigella dysenteriae]|uniref:hypothetical protein n=1 Tax=Shigella dysenteriae TaxID=622 RepID=UPI0010712642|nr:hypothetical protein [Shigella dysenteriae]WNT52957.1 hypothetical protein PWP84_23605 [Shigella dysenteriae]
MNVNAGHERTSKARIIHQIQLIRGITNWRLRWHISALAKHMEPGGSRRSWQITELSSVEPPRVSWRVFYL